MSPVLVSVRDRDGVTVAVVDGDRAHALGGRPSMLEVLDDWSSWSPRLSQESARGREIDLADVSLLPPVPSPPNMYMAGANYRDHMREMDGGEESPAPEGPFFFLRPTTTLVAHGDPIVLPDSSQVDWEAELAVVIGRRAHHVSSSQALDCVAGYTVANDVTARDRLRRGEGSPPPMRWDWLRAKGWYGTCPLGPHLVPADQVSDPDDLAISLTLNGATEQQARTSQMICSVGELIASISAVVPLVPGDVVCTGTPAGVGMGKGRFLAAGDVVTVEIERVGRLENTVAAATG